MHDAPVAFSLGSNLGRREERILEAVERLGRTDGLVLEAVSSLYETSPVGLSTHHAFINAACTARTHLAPLELLDACKEIERTFGRLPSVETADRAIDIDIVLYGDMSIGGPTLVVPHPRMRERLFVLLPLAEIAPDMPVPPDGAPIRELLRRFAGEGEAVRVSSRGWIP